MNREPIVFQCEASLWDIMAETDPQGYSAKPFDMRRWDMSDDRIYRLSGARAEWPRAIPHAAAQHAWWQPSEPSVSFRNKATSHVLTFEYLGVEFPGWAFGWGFLVLGKLLHHNDGRLYPPQENPEEPLCQN